MLPTKTLEGKKDRVVCRGTKVANGHPWLEIQTQQFPCEPCVGEYFFHSVLREEDPWDAFLARPS